MDSMLCEQIETWFNKIEGLCPPDHVNTAREGWRLTKERAALPVGLRDGDPLLSRPEMFFMLILLRSSIESTVPDAGFFDLKTLTQTDPILQQKVSDIDDLPEPCRSSVLLRTFYEFVIYVYRLRYVVEFKLDNSDNPWPLALFVQSKAFGPYWIVFGEGFEAPDGNRVFSMQEMAACREKLEQQIEAIH